MHPQKTLKVKFQNRRSNSTKSDKDVQDSQRKDGQMNIPTWCPIRPLEVNAAQLMILISVAVLQNLHVAGTESLTQNST